MPVPADQQIITTSTIASGGWTSGGLLHVAIQPGHDEANAGSEASYGNFARFGLAAPLDQFGYGIKSVALWSEDIADNNQGASYYLMEKDSGKVLIKWAYGGSSWPIALAYRSNAQIASDGGSIVTKQNGSPGLTDFSNLPRVFTPDEAKNFVFIMADEIDAGEAPPGGITVFQAYMQYRYAELGRYQSGMML